MSTNMHRLQISLPQWEMQFLEERARRDGHSIAEVVRQLIQREATAAQSGSDSVWEIAGIAADEGALIHDVPVSERPDLYLAAHTVPPPAVRKRRSGSAAQRRASR
jgi:hypothetical protein